ncbi:glycosyltransferase [Brevundimonas sp. NIBR11]|uniref:glycosyltransferase n=1 Tax=Brevundimonas sp. NIBR11 TaxID=3015999 RepID=UPI0022F063A0|nr:glycosyltransferase [Brevundimonas sp. NIBR11]WGM30050.1 O-mycaminosyltylonolide 6-deoxyallosyltransferase [Brevundimonas sp. NIBR11]
MALRIVLCTAGSLGDLHPFIALGLALKARGVQAEIATSVDYGGKILAEGLIFHSIGPGLAELERRFGMDKAELTERVAKSNTFLFEKMLLPNLEDGARAVTAAAEGSVAIVGSTFAAGAGMAADVLGVPFIPAALQPSVVFSPYDPPLLPKTPWMRPATGGLQLAVNRATVALARAATGRWTRPIDAVRARLGLPPRYENLLLDGLKSRPVSLGLYSPLLAWPQPDAPPGFAVTGYAAYDSEAGGASVMPPALERFLADGSEPVVFTLGSAAVHIPGGFYVESLKAARRIGRRAVLLVGPEGDLRVADGRDAIAVAYAPFSQLFPRAAAVVHQGGVGTTQQALRAGRPQLVVPHLGDQFDNGARVARLGCGAVVTRGRYRAERVAEGLGGLLGDAGVLETARRLGVVAMQEDGAGAAADRILAALSRSQRA